MPKPYNPSETEAKWRKRWEEEKVYNVDLKKAKKPYYTHVMWPYPSGDKLHVGHWYNFGPADTHARYMRMKGMDVFSPMGFDAFGLPAENYAIKTGIHPDISTKNNVQTMIDQLQRMGCMYQWDYMANSSDPEYYKWTQWLFLQMYAHGLAYKKEGMVNWCPSCQTVLANEQVIDGRCERCDSEVVQKPLAQWYWKTTKYAQRLLDGLKDLEWPEKTKKMQENWIGKKDGVNLTYGVAGTKRGVIGWDIRAKAHVRGAAHPVLKDRVTDHLVLTDQVATDAAARSVIDNPVLTPSRPGDSKVLTPSRPGDSNLALQREVKSSEAGLKPDLRTVHLVFEPHRRTAMFADSGIASSMLRIIERVAERHGLCVHEACVMPDHLHVLMSFERSRDLMKDVTRKLKGGSAHDFNRQFGRKGTLWADGGHHENVDSREQFNAVLAYIQQNPLKAQIDQAGRILSQLPLAITTFTTRPDTNFGATFVVLAPEHPFAKKVMEEKIVPEDGSQAEQVKKYYAYAMSKTERERQEEGRKKTGVFTGFYSINQLTNRPMPIWVSDFVLGSFGTGAVVGVPGHDMRDFEFAKEFGIPVIRVVVADDGDTSEIERIEQVQEEEGAMVNSGFLNGLPIMEAKEKIMDHIVAKGWGERVKTYRLRDWLVSRQRYWGAPIPIVYDPEGKPHPVPEEHLPWLLPTDVEFKPTGKSPLTYSKEFIERTEKIFGKGWTPEYDTMDTFVCSSYYSFMYLGASHEGGAYRQRDLSTGAPADPELEKKWMPVSMYIGGPEHATGHLIYARFVAMVLKDIGVYSHEEPFKRLVHQGLITHGGAKMSKSKGNVVSPDAFVDRHGADVFRMYLMFMGPFTDGGDWSDAGIKGIDRFVQRAWTVMTEKSGDDVIESAAFQTLLHKTIKRVTDSISTFHFNTAISALMEFLNAAEEAGQLSRETALTFTKLIAPLAPHLAEELWETLGGSGFVVDQEWPSYDAAQLVSDTMTIVVQVNGKLRGNIEVPSDMAEPDIIAKAKDEENVRKFLTGPVRKEVYVKGRLVSLVV